MKFLFYLSSIVFLFEELRWIVSPAFMAKKSLQLKKFTKDYANKSYDDFSPEYKKEIPFLLMKFIFIFGWIFVGLFTFQWSIFLLFIAFQFIIIAPISYMVQKAFYPYTFLHWFNSIIGMSFILFAIINAYHLKIDIDLIKLLGI